ncbi:MAG: M48 family metalloprotease [Candidatus Bathyarchaeota archaeon]|nr:M48 family metalloprotease [Candidatus Bathyarchaeota archaeon]MDH5595264.1 M48 family metalloprotease [Candidatus Bathyarchaeota archaeon]
MSSENLDRVLSSAKPDTRLKVVIGEYARRGGFQQNWVAGLQFVHQHEVSPAFGFGMNFPSFLGYPEFPVGAILVSDNFCGNLPEEELEFVVAHELGHIVNNHSIQNLVVFGAKEIFVLWLAEQTEIPVDTIRNGIGLLKNIIYVLTGQRTIEEQITAQKEKDADKYAVVHQRTKEPAISVLTKITNGNIDIPTHLTVDGSFVTPAITARERIEAIRNLYLGYF